MADSQPAVRIFYRIVLNNPPTRLDFTSKIGLGIPPPVADLAIVRLWDGLSAYATEAQARRVARRYPQLGRYIAWVSIPEAGVVAYERTLVSPGHHTLWGQPEELIRSVIAVVPV